MRLYLRFGHTNIIVVWILSPSAITGQEVGKPAEKADDKVAEAPEGKTGSASS